MALHIWYVSGRKADGTRVDSGPFFSEAEARQWARDERLTAVVAEDVTRQHALGKEDR